MEDRGGLVRGQMDREQAEGRISVSLREQRKQERVRERERQQ